MIFDFELNCKVIYIYGLFNKIITPFITSSKWNFVTYSYLFITGGGAVQSGGGQDLNERTLRGGQIVVHKV